MLFSRGMHFNIITILFLVTLCMTLTPKGIYFWIIFGGLLIFTIPWYKYLDRSAIFICLFGIFYGIFSILLDRPYSGSSIISYLIVPLPIYCLGCWSINKFRDNDSLLTTFIFLSLLCISSVLLYRTVVDISHGEIVSVSRTFEIEGIETISATLYGMYAALTMVGLPMFFTSTQRWTFQSLMFLALATLGILTTIHLINRTGLVIAIMVTLVGVVYRSRGNLGKFLLLVGFITIILYLLIKFEIIPSDVIAAYKFRNEESRELGMSAAGGRSYRWIDAIGRIFYMPFGWYGREHLTGYNYVHNWWLDVGRVVGLFPFLLLIIPTIISIKNCYTLFKEKGNDIHLLLITLNAALFLATFVEPVMEGSVMIAYFYFFVWGMTSQVAKIL